MCSKTEWKIQRVPIYPLPLYTHANPISIIPHHSGACGTMPSLYWHLTIPQSPSFISGLTLGGVHSVGLDKCIMAYIHHSDTAQKSFTALKIPCALPMYSNFSKEIRCKFSFATLHVYEKVREGKDWILDFASASGKEDALCCIFCSFSHQPKEDPQLPLPMWGVTLVANSTSSSNIQVYVWIYRSLLRNWPLQQPGWAPILFSNFCPTSVHLHEQLSSIPALLKHGLLLTVGTHMGVVCVQICVHEFRR